MTDKPKPAKPPKHKVDPHYGEIPAGPERYPDSLGKRIGNRLLSWLTLWK